jgi:hypothetical protein
MDLNGGKEVISILITVGNAKKLLVTSGILRITHVSPKSRAIGVWRVLAERK